MQNTPKTQFFQLYFFVYKSGTLFVSLTSASFYGPPLAGFDSEYIIFSDISEISTWIHGDNIFSENCILNYHCPYTFKTIVIVEKIKIAVRIMCCMTSER